MGKISENVKVDYNLSNDGLGVTLQALFNGMEGVLHSRSVVGEPMEVGDAVIIPLVEISAGLASGALKNNAKNNGAGAMSAKMSPVAMLVFQDGKVRLINVKNQDIYTRLLDLVPETIDKITKGHVSPEAKAAAEQMAEDAQVEVVQMEEA